MTDNTIRASDREREHSVETLREHAAQGRLTLEEFQQRMESAYGATTRGDLETLLRDLPGDTHDQGMRGTRQPAEPASGRIPGGASAAQSRAWLGKRRNWLAPVLVLALVASITTAAVSGDSAFFPWPLFALFWVFGAGGCRKARVHRDHARPH